MKICLAQTRSYKGEIGKNIQNHINLINRALPYQPDMIVFPELSLTNYEPTLAANLSTTEKDPIFEPFQALAHHNKIIVSVGMPIHTQKGVHICMLSFQPDTVIHRYSKRILHEDELPYFVPSDDSPVVKTKSMTLGLGICYEALQQEHLDLIRKNQVDIFIASVSKPQASTTNAYQILSSFAREAVIPVLLVNTVGPCDNFMSAGLTAVWNPAGELLDQLNPQSQGLLIYDMACGEVEKEE